MKKLYGNRDVMALDEEFGFYSRHVSAMTVENLYSKSDIAAELAYRDSLIKKLTDTLNETRDYLAGCETGGPVLLGLVCVIDEALDVCELSGVNRD